MSLRALAALLALIALSCSKSKERHGEVVAVTGEVTATRGDDKPRTLQVGDRLEGSDRIAVGDGGEIKIRLTHNGVLMVYSASTAFVLGETVAWKASGDVKAGVLDSDPDDKTNAAGIHSENEAATDPNAVLADQVGGGEAPETTAAEPPGDPEPETGSDTRPPESKQTESGGDKRGDDTRGGDKRGDDTRGGDKRGGPASNDIADPFDNERPKRRAPKVAVSKATDAELTRVARSILGKLLGKLRGCADPLAFRAVLRFKNGAVIATELSGKLDAKQTGCIGAAFSRVKVPAKLDGSATISVE